MPFPADNYTPHGYLDIPTHTRNLSPRGVLRSYDAGFRWHYPAFPGMYGGRRETYRAGLRIGLEGALELADYDTAVSPYHTKNMLIFELGRGAARARAEFHALGDQALRATIAWNGAARLNVHLEYTRLLAANGEWGESGLVGRLEDDLLIVQGFEDGEAFALWSSHPAALLGLTPDPRTASAWAGAGLPEPMQDGFLVATGRPGEQLALHAVLLFVPQTETTRRREDEPLPLAPSPVLELVLARGRTADEARRHLDEARRTAGAERARLLAEDDAFWAQAPRLAGDWPDSWRRGLVYDLETLRMMVKPPLGIYRHRWDAMQIQAPRVVLAEAAIDALLLSYADAQLAQQLLLGTLLDAPLPNIPCSREDGSFNMVAADGTVCGTAPAWGYPFLVVEWLATLRPDDAWLARIYPRLADYLDWWLTQRRASDGWLFYACSWESGQDDSPRFGAQPLGGGHPIRHIRPLDLHAAMAHAAAVMQRFARTLGRTHDQRKWARLAAEFAARTSTLWNGARYADFDTTTGALTAVDDIMLLAPLALSLPHRHPAARDAIARLHADALIWPMNAWTACAAALAADLPEKAAELAAAVCERAYGYWDARLSRPGRTLPGIACEYWPTDGRCGGEGYGWGAFTTHLLLHVLVGIAPTSEGLRIRPNLPLGWRVVGRRYEVWLHWRERPVEIAIEPLNDERVAVTVNGQREEIGWGEEVEF
jgi:hypothetical protein